MVPKETMQSQMLTCDFVTSRGGPCVNRLIVKTRLPGENTPLQRVPLKP